MSNTIIISVGTSLLANLLDTSAELDKIFRGTKDCDREIRVSLKQLQTLEEEDKEEIVRGYLTDAGAITYNALNFDGYISYFCEYMHENIRKRRNRDGPNDLLPAEISSLFLFYYDADGKLRENFTERAGQTSDDFGKVFTEKDRIVLLCTDTADSVLCAVVLREMIQKSQAFCNKCYVPPQNGEDPYDFENGIVVIQNLDMMNNAEMWIDADERGLKNGYGVSNLKKFIGKIAGDSVLIIRTGSYKELSADLLLLAAEFGLSTFYLFENSTESVRHKVKDKIPDLTYNIFKSISNSGPC